MRPRLEAAREHLRGQRRHLRQHRRQRGRPPAAAHGRGVRRGQLPRPGRGEPQREGSPAGQGVRDEPRVPPRYAQDAAACVLDASSTETVDASDFPLTDPDGRRYRHLPLRNTNKKFNPATARTLHFTIWGDPETGEVRTHEFAGAQEIGPVFGDGRPAVWRWSRPLIDRRPDDLVCRVVKGVARGAGRRLPEGLAARRARARSCARSGSPRRSGRPTPPSPSSRRSSVTSSSRPSRPGCCGGSSPRCPTTSLVLDFFAGSGTTGHAVALQNAEDGGTRRCVSINSAEPTREGSNARNAGLLTVADITRARLRAVGGPGGRRAARSLTPRGGAGCRA